jgi:ribose-phosphate pyrophosphokinase
MARDIRARYKERQASWSSRPTSAASCAPARSSKRLNDAPLAIVDKRRDKPGESEVMNVIGEHRRGKDCFLIDDIIDSGGTLCNAAEALLDKGAKSVTAYITHGVLSGGAVNRIILQADGTGDHRFHPADRSRLNPRRISASISIAPT